MFAKHVTKDVQVPSGETVTVRKLSGKSLDKARVARRADQVQSIREIGPDLIKAFRDVKEAKEAGKEAEVAAPVVAEVPEPTPEEKAAARKATFEDYDRYVVLNAGIVRWTSKEALTPANIDELDTETAELLANEILELSVPVSNAAEVQGKD